MREGEVGIPEALGRLGSSSQTERAKGLGDLHLIFKYNGHNARVEAIEDKSYHVICENLFRYASSEKSSYVRASTKKSAKNTSASRLSQCAGVLRLVIEAGVRNMRTKTVFALLDHITQTLPTADGTFCEPLMVDYSKCLRLLLEYPPHVEHLPRKQRWQETVGFCLQSIKLLDTNSNSDGFLSLQSNGAASIRASSTSLENTLRTSMRDVGTKVGDTNIVLTELIVCLRELTRATNAPVLDKAKDVLSVLLDFLQSSPSVSRAHQDAFAAINSVLLRTVCDEIRTTQKAIRVLVPLIKDFWSTKDPSLKEKMLTTLVLAKPHIAHLIETGEDVEFREDIENLLENIRMDYAKKLPREQLQLDDLSLWTNQPDGRSDDPLAIPVFRLRTGNARSESQWATLSFISTCTAKLDAARALGASEQDPSEVDERRKRVKLSRGLDDHLHRLSEVSPTSKLCTLQILAFTGYDRAIEAVDLENILNHLMVLMSDQNGAISSWATLALASCAFQKTSRSAELLGSWMKVFQVASRNLPSTSSCRAACHLMDVLLRLKVVDFTLVHETLEVLFSSIDLNGPVIFCESSSSLWAKLIQLSAAFNPSTAHTTTERILHWLLSKWSPSRFEDKSYAFHETNCDSYDVLQIIASCTERTLEPRHRPMFPILTQVGQACQNAENLAKLTEYLLLLPEKRHYLVDVGDMKTSSESTMPQSSQRSLSADILLMDFCNAESTKVRQTLEDILSDRPKHLSADMARIITNFCFVTSSLVSQGDVRNARRVELLRSSTDALIKSFAAFISIPECEQDRVDTSLTLLSTRLPRLADIPSLDQRFFAETGVLSFSGHLSKALKARRQFQQSTIMDEGYDLMDLDDGMDSQASHQKAKSSFQDAPRQDVASTYDPDTFRASTSAYIYLVSSAFQSMTVEGEGPGVPDAFVEHLLSLSAYELCGCRPLMTALSLSNFGIAREDAKALIVHLGASFLQEYEYERSEVAIGMCVESLTAFAHMWTEQSAGSFYGDVADVYEWVVKVGIKPEISSPNALIGITRLFRKLLKVKADYGTPSLPSARTSLFQILCDGNIAVKFYIAQHVSDMFGQFVLSQHDSIFDDVAASLPHDGGWKEGIALRLLVLCRLAAAWHTLLRKCVFLIFQTAGETSIDPPVRHARYCLLEISKSLSLNGAPALFRLFAPQLLYSWLEDDPVALDGKEPKTLEEIPFAVFGYQSLKDLLEDSQDEVISQIEMRGQQKQLDICASHLKSSGVALVDEAFGKVLAYTMSKDTNISRRRPKPTSESELSVCNLLGKERFSQCVRQYYPYAIGTFLSAMSVEVHRIDLFSKYANLAEASTALEEMHKLSSSDKTLPSGQQPMFPGKLIFTQIHKICTRVKIDSSQLWTPELFVYIARMLFNGVHPALGSLHTCSIVRKVRILIALAGKVALSGYALEMSLHSLRPLLTDSQCADDALGIVQYLFTYGKRYLLGQLSFLSGSAASILVSLRLFLASPQDSTTQESEHQATMSKVQAFHTWLIAYLDEIHNDEAHEIPRAFLSLTRAAGGTRSEGNAQKNTAESDLLLALLQEEKSSSPLLKGPSRNGVFGLLCGKFQRPPTFHNDILGADVDAESFSVEVYQTCQRGNVSKGYLLWAARVLGRAYSANGQAEALLGSKNLLPQEQPDRDDGRTDFSTSKSEILSILTNLLLSNNLREVSLAEHTLRSIINSVDAVEDYAEIDRHLPLTLAATLAIRVPAKGLKLSGIAAESIEQSAVPIRQKSLSIWARDLTISLCGKSGRDAIINELPTVLSGIEGIAEQLFPSLLHRVLLQDLQGQQHVRQAMSSACHHWFSRTDEESIPFMQLLLKALMYLRRQPYPHERSAVDRAGWLEIDNLEVASAATRCGMFTTSLLFAEFASHDTPRTSSRRSSFAVQQSLPSDLLIRIYKNLDEPDSYYGVQQRPNLESILQQLDYEGDGFKSLLYRGARLDSQMRQAGEIRSDDAAGVVRSLVDLNMSSITQALLSNQQFRNIGPGAVNSSLYTARRLETWDIRAPETEASEASIVFRALQGINNATDPASLRSSIDRGLLDAVKMMTETDSSVLSKNAAMRTLAVLTEADEIISADSADDLKAIWQRMKTRTDWMQGGRFADVRAILSTRDTLFSIFGRKEELQNIIRSTPLDARTVETQSLFSHSTVARKHGALQDSLSVATHLTQLIPHCREVGLDIEGAAHFELAGVLWDQGEMSTSINMLHDIVENVNFQKNSTALGKSTALATLAHHVAEARLEKPEEIVNKYLEPAIRELKGQKQGAEAGHVFHQFAVFCYQQLQNQDNIDDFNRLQKLRDSKAAELELLKNHFQTLPKGKERANVGRDFDKARKWFELDNEDYRRLRVARENFLRASLENYLLSLQACDGHDNDVLQFVSLWLQYADTKLANNSVRKVLDKVPSAKFAILMNQLSSRLQLDESDFQKLLSNLIYRICCDHPYHGLYHVYSGMQIQQHQMKDEATKSRHGATNQIAGRLKQDKRMHEVWGRVHNSNQRYKRLAELKDKEAFKMNMEIPLRKNPLSEDMVKMVVAMRVPPVTLPLELRATCDYSDVPIVTGFAPKMKIANGLSAPKIITAFASDGKQYKQLLKGGNDDLRQDAIMEQVFDQVSRFLKSHTATRQRNLYVRTYKVLPLSSAAGIMEFVRDTAALHDVLMPAHARYYPTDFGQNTMRTKIHDAETSNDSKEARIKNFKQIIEKFHPVGRFFFLERFLDPDEWFQKRLAYTRSTAAISILGHVLGLGDRHCHNILLDERSGEVVHIDLGVAFEAGRILPIPELVPFRLTRDLVDAMGYTGTEGVFRRCCEFTLDALREERESIMTLLNVLRYDPLYSWTVTPVKARKIQQNQDQGQEEKNDGGEEDAAKSKTAVEEIPATGKRKEDEASEAGRALSVVEKKLSKTLSTAATVSELIQQATDVRNLALLYSGWGAYA
ncbi:hypothetical protein K402DRAFT_460730 [Aulographum hederae CBS 113979]|uniref:Serine/threonine-protein kinase Tel1 n=1 Tax=Aulographum hederae CBS 113979 TaxID=1176131 RepID=A0A6G1HAF2_9PEZI|nr:hypothetical protein K402DRAFT_460730 [Aulographum hederae CBS 113979]